MSRTVVQFDLSEEGLDAAIAQVEAYKDELKRKCNELIKLLAEQGKDIAKMKVAAYGAVDTGGLERGITGFFDEESRTGFIRADTWYAVYVEYGTGVTGLKNSHPLKGADWYDIHHHGDAGWVFFNSRTGKFTRTRGMPARPFMYDTMVALTEQAKAAANIIFK